MKFLSGRQRLGAAALLLAISALLSRLMGLARDKIISWQFGANTEADMYFAAFVVPDIINYLLAGGFMSITMIPLLASAFRRDEANAWRLFSVIVFWMAAGATLLTAVCELMALPLARLVAPGFDSGQTARLAGFMRIILPGQIFFLTGACFTALLFLRRQFAVPALSPLIYNGCIIVFGLCLPLVAGRDIGMTGYCVGVSIGAFLGAFLLPLAVAAREGVHFRPALWHPGLKRFLYIALPLMLGQTAVMLDEQFLRVFGSMLPEGNVSLLNYARRIAQVPVSLMGQALAVASYPFLVKLLADNEQEKFASTLNSALAAGLTLIIPVCAWMLAAAAPILGLIFEGGRFGAAETALATPLAQLMLAAGPLWIIYMVLARAFYASEDTLTPALTGTAITALCIPCYYWLAVPAGAWAIAAISGASLCCYVIWLALIWRRRNGGRAFQNLGRISLKMLACSLPAALAAWFAVEWCDRIAGGMNGLLRQLLMLATSGIAFAALGLPLARWLAPDLLSKLAQKLNRKA